MDMMKFQLLPCIIPCYLEPLISRHADKQNVLTSRDYLVIYGDYLQTSHGMGEGSSLPPGGGSVYQQLCGVKARGGMSPCYEVHLDIYLSIWQFIIESSRENGYYFVDVLRMISIHYEAKILCQDRFTPPPAIL